VEIRNVGIVEMPTTHGPVALILTLDPAAARFPLAIAERTLAGIAVPTLPFVPGDAVQALRAEAALQRHGLPLPKAGEKA
ncbi:MAG: aldolase, partial [Pseudomonadota bacterium]|nr:aldolase [Pseudomonadota bacterium]